MRRLLLTALTLSLLVGCSNESSKTCTSDTPLVKVGDGVITVGYYREFKKNLPTAYAEQFHSERELLDELVERRLVLLDSLEKEVFERPEIKEKVERFRIKNLAYRFLNGQVGDYSVSEKEVEEFIKRHYPNKKITPELKKRVRVSLEAKKFLRKREELLKRFSSSIHFLNGNEVVAVYKGEKIRLSELKPLLGSSSSPEKVKKAVLLYILYKEALKKGLDKNKDFLFSYNRFLEKIAFKEFKEELLSSVKVSDEEIRDYYEKHKAFFKRPAEAEVVIYEFRNKEEAEKALSSNSLRDGRAWKVTAADKDTNPVSTLVFKEKKERGVITLPDGRALLVVVKRRFPERELLLGDVYKLIKEKLTLQKAEELYRQRVEKLKEKYGVKYYAENLSCIK